MTKINTILEAPVLNRSGYGDMSDDIFHALKTNKSLDLLVVPVNWGSCVPKTTMREKDKVILSHLPKEAIKKAPDLYISVTIPHIAPPRGKYNVNVSCIVEVDKAPNYLVEGFNKYQLGIVTSNHAKNVLVNSDVKPTTPIEVVYLGEDTTIYKADAETQANVDIEMAKITESEVFLYCGQITHPHLFKDRKNADTLIKTFCEAFKDKSDIALVIKCSGTNFSNYDRNALLERIKLLQKMANSNAPVYLMHGELTEKEMAYLFAHKKVIAHVSFARGESFGLSTLQGSLCAKPFFITNWSANNEIITEPLFLLDGELVTIPADVESEYYVKGSKWFEVDTAKAKAKLLDFYANRQPYNDAAIKLAAKNAEYFSLDKLNNRFNRAITKHFKT